MKILKLLLSACYYLFFSFHNLTLRAFEHTAYIKSSWGTVIWNSSFSGFLEAYALVTVRLYSLGFLSRGDGGFLRCPSLDALILALSYQGHRKMVF